MMSPRTPFFWVVVYVHIAIGVIALIASIAAARARPGSPEHRRAGWWFVQAVAGLFVTTMLMASVRYTLFLFLIGYVAWYGAHQAWLTMARPGDRVYLASPLARAVQHDLAVVLGLVMIAAVIAMRYQDEYPFTLRGMGEYAGLLWGGGLAMLGAVARAGGLDRLPSRERHVVWMTFGLTATWAEFVADVTVHFMRPKNVWIVAWLVTPIVAAALLHRLVDLRAGLARVLTGRGPGGAPPQSLPESSQA
jgi:hypothetical protein